MKIVLTGSKILMSADLIGGKYILNGIILSEEDQLILAF